MRGNTQTVGQSDFDNSNFCRTQVRLARTPVGIVTRNHSDTHSPWVRHLTMVSTLGKSSGGKSIDIILERP